MIQPMLVTGGTIVPTIGVDVDFGSVSPTAAVSSFVATGGIYDTSLYDSSFYAQGPLPQSVWQSVQAEGHALAVRMKVNVLLAEWRGRWIGIRYRDVRQHAIRWFPRATAVDPYDKRI